MNKPIQNGILAGVVGIIIYLVTYFLKPTLIFNLVPWLIFAVVLGMMIKSAIDQKKSQNGFISLQEALKNAWLPAIIAITITSIFRYVLLTIIDPSLMDMQIQIALEQTEKMLGMFGQEIDGDAYDSMEKEMRNKSKLTFPKVLLGILINWILHFIPAIIIALVIKNKKEEYNTID